MRNGGVLSCGWSQERLLVASGHASWVGEAWLGSEAPWLARAEDERSGSQELSLPVGEYMGSSIQDRDAGSDGRDRGAKVEKPLGLSSHKVSGFNVLSRAGGWTLSVSPSILKKSHTGGGEVADGGKS